MSNSNKWEVIYLPEAEKDLKKLNRNQQIEVVKAITKVSQNPLPNYRNGYGKPLTNKRDTNLKGYLKIKLKKSGIRIVYRLIEISENQMIIIIIGARQQFQVYDQAVKRIKKHNLSNINTD